MYRKIVVRLTAILWIGVHPNQWFPMHSLVHSVWHTQHQWNAHPPRVQIMCIQPPGKFLVNKKTLFLIRKRWLFTVTFGWRPALGTRLRADLDGGLGRLVPSRLRRPTRIDLVAATFRGTVAR